MSKSRNVLTVRSNFRGYSTCLRCARPWDKVGDHSTSYTDKQGCFPLCECCWSDLTPELRLPYYRILVFEVWESPDDWPAIEAAVLAGR